MNVAQFAERSREVRLGIVMFGGVSLAVYINGISNELFRAARGRGVYRLLKALTDSHIVVDILSGASAGGINSVLLSAALCNGSDFESTQTLWHEFADIERLLAQTDARRPIDNSVLNGDYDQQQLEAAVRSLLTEREQTAEKEDPSRVDELDLFITGTDIHGQFDQRRDALGHGIELEDHRVLFQLKHRAGRKEPFSATAFQNGRPHAPETTMRTTTNVRALAKLAHITACFPGAFEPLVVLSPARDFLANLRDDHERGPDQAELIPQLVDTRLAYWGQLADKASGAARNVTLMDGGVLKNKPFTSTIEAIFTRLADTQVSRYMLYVEPDPKEAADARRAATKADTEARARLEHRPPSAAGSQSDPATRIVSVAIAAASGLPRFESIDADLRSVDLHNEQVLRYESLIAAATEAVMSLPPDARAASPAREAYQRARLADLASKVEDALHARAPAPTAARRGVDPRLTGLINLIAELDRRPTLQQLYAEFDVLFRFRRLVNLSYALDDQGIVELPPAVEGIPHARRKRRVAFAVPSGPGKLSRAQVERELLTTLNRQIELYEIVRARLEDELAALAPAQLALGDAATWKKLAERARAVLASLPLPACFDVDSALPALDLCLTRDELQALAKPHPLPAVPPLESPAGAVGFLQAADRFEERLLARSQILLDLYSHFEQIDEVGLPLELVSGLRGRDQIQTVRVSPVDANRAFAGRFSSKPGASPFASKLCGVQLVNFGAFFKRSWRANDLMWGRIDGSAQLLDILLDPRRLAQLDLQLLHDNLVDALGPKLDLSEIFPHAPASLRSSLEAWLVRLVSPETAAAAREELAPQDSIVRTHFAHAVQLEILTEQLPGVLEDAAAEAEDASGADLLYQAQRLRTVPGEIDRYFWPESYTIAQESLPADMPREKMLRLLRTAGQHLKAAIAQSIPERDSALRLLFGPVASTAIWALSRRWVDSAKARKPNER